MDAKVIEEIVTGYQDGRNLIELPSALGGIIVDDEITALAAKIEDVLDIFAQQHRKPEFFTEILRVMKRAQEKGEDLAKVLDGWLDEQLEITCN